MSKPPPFNVERDVRDKDALRIHADALVESQYELAQTYIGHSSDYYRFVYGVTSAAEAIAVMEAEERQKDPDYVRVKTATAVRPFVPRYSDKEWMLNKINSWSARMANAGFSCGGPNKSVANVKYLDSVQNVIMFTVKDSIRRYYGMCLSVGQCSKAEEPIGPKKGLLLFGPAGLGKSTVLKLTERLAAEDLTLCCPGLSVRPHAHFTGEDIVAQMLANKFFLESFKKDYGDRVISIFNLGLETPANAYGQWLDLYPVIEWRYELWHNGGPCTCFTTNIGCLKDAYFKTYTRSVPEKIEKMTSMIHEMSVRLDFPDCLPHPDQHYRKRTY